MSHIPFCPVKPIRGGRPLDGLFRKLMVDPMWVCQAKLDGRRAIWDGQTLWSRQGNRLPKHNLDGIPVTMDGEWMDDTFHAFDLPDHGGGLRERWADLTALVEQYRRPGLALCPLTTEWADIQQWGWEGVVFKRWSSLYPKSMQDGKTTAEWVKYRAEWGTR
jgi:ATP-dependent DNA ligase